MRVSVAALGFIVWGLGFRGWGGEGEGEGMTEVRSMSRHHSQPPESAMKTSGTFGIGA